MQRIRAYQTVLGCALLAIVLSVSLVACTDQEATTPMTNPHVAALEQLPAFHLVYPGATLLRQGARPPTVGFGGKEGAIVGKVYGMAAPLPPTVDANVILVWYRKQLATLDWTFMAIPKGSGFTVEAYWIEGKYYADVGIYDPQQVHVYEPSVDTTKYPLVFDLTIGERGYMGG
jgi:hypothetical protein